MKRSLLKKVVACASSLALACALVPATALTALADDSLTIDDDTVFYVQATDTATGTTTVLETYTEQELAEVTENYPTVSYAVNGAVYSTDSYVTMDTLLDGVEQWASGAYVQFECYDGSYAKFTYDYDTYATTTRYFYPNNVVTDASTSTLSTDETSATAVPDVIALGSEKVSFTDGQPTLKDLISTENADDTWRFLMGVTESGTYNAGRYTPSGVEGITVVYDSTYTGSVDDDSSDADDSGTDSSSTVTEKATQELSIAVATKSVKVKKVKTKKRTVKALTVKKNKGKVTYKKTGGSKKLTVNASTGKITVKKGTKKGTYKVKVRVKAAATDSYAASSTIVTVKVKVVK